MSLLIAAFIALLFALFLGRKTIFEFFCFLWEEAFEHPAAACAVIGLFLFLFWIAGQCP